MKVDRESGLLVVMLSALCVALWLLGVLAWEAGQTPVECEGGGDCSEGYYCSKRVCIADTSADEVLVRKPACRAGNPCPSEGCELPEDSDLQCIEGHYSRIVGAEVCRKKEALDFIQKTVRKCGNAKACTAAQLKEVVISTGDFDALLRQFDTVFAIHFDYGHPRKWEVKGRSPKWNKTRAHYIDNVRPLIPMLAKAEVVILVATASSTGVDDTGKNGVMALRRLLEARSVIEEAAKATEGAGSSSTDKLPIIKDANLSDGWPLNGDRYSLLSLKRSILWDTKDEERFLRVIDSRGHAPTEQREWVEETINQAVFVIPIPCRVETGD